MFETFQYLAGETDPTTYYAAIFFIFTFGIYWFVIRSGYVIHAMQPLGNVGQTDQTITTVTKSKDKDGKEIETTVETKIKGNTGVYREIAKKKYPFSIAGKTINMFGSPRNPRSHDKGRTFFVDNSGVSYIHWRNRHIYFDTESMMPIKMQQGTFNPDSHGWFVLFELKLIELLHNKASTPPPKAGRGYGTFTLAMIVVVAFAIGYFVAIAYGHQLSPALFQNSITTTTTTLSNTVTTSAPTITVTSSTTTVINGTTHTLPVFTGHG